MVKSNLSLTKLVELLDRFIKRDVVLIPSNDDLRVSHVVKGGVHFYLLVNEGEESIKGELKTNVIGRVEKWDAWNGKCEEIVVHGETVASEARIPLLLQRRESAILCIDTSRPPNIETSNIVRRETMRRIKELKPDNEWDIRIDEHKVDGSFMYKSWTQWPGMEDYWGTVSYKNEFVIDADEMENITSVVLDLGEVYEIAHIIGFFKMCIF